MGKGDKKSKRGKIWKGSYGNTRKRKSAKERLKKQLAKDGAPAATGEQPAKRTARKKEEA